MKKDILDIKLDLDLDSDLKISWTNVHFFYTINSIKLV